jgi:mono/diheme cytochrome c family protein
VGFLEIAALSMLSIAAAPLQCPQPRFTGSAPQEYLQRTNPFDAQNVDFKVIEKLYGGDVNPAINCAICHGKKGDGRGPLSDQYTPPPRNFACAKTIEGVPDGQLFWIIRFGSPQTAMPPHPAMSEDDVWKMVLYLRRLAK